MLAIVYEKNYRKIWDPKWYYLPSEEFLLLLLASKSLISLIWGWIDYTLVSSFVELVYFWFASTPRVEPFGGPFESLGCLLGTLLLGGPWNPFFIS